MRTLYLLLLAACGGAGSDAEICDNGADDDGDGFVDCADQDCAGSCREADCGDGVDDDADGRIDCDDPDCVDACDLVCPEGNCAEDCTNGVDDDLDFQVDCADPDCAFACDADGDGWQGNGGPDCDDGNAAVNPDEDEVPYDGLDNDCDEATPDDDLDGDGFLAAADCDDASAATYPGAPETCGNGQLDDCDDPAPPPLDTCYGERPLSSADAFLTSGTADGFAGQSVGWLPDASGDGVPELLVGAYGENMLGGAGFLMHGPLAGSFDLADATLKMVAESEDDWVGYAMAGTGNVAGGPVPVIAVSARYDDSAGNQAGAVYLVNGGDQGTLDLSAARSKILGQATGDSFGFSVSGAGDTNDDGVADLIVGAPFVKQSDDGAAYLFHGPIRVGAVQVSEAAVRFEGEKADDQAGCSVAGGADVDGDGYDDVAVGSCFNDRGGENAGAVFLFRGGPSMAAVRSVATAEGGLQGDEAQARAGTAIAFGDLDDDGLPDLIVGGPGAGDDAGRVWVIKGNAPLLAPSFASWDGLSAGDLAGTSVASADIDGDGRDDLIVGAPGVDVDGMVDAGAAYVFFGPVSGRSLSPDIVITGTAAYGFAGQAVSGVPDVDGDGRDELLVGAPFLDAGAPGSGAVGLFQWGW
jgi:hypothetical protein